MTAVVTTFWRYAVSPRSVAGANLWRGHVIAHGTRVLRCSGSPARARWRSDGYLPWIGVVPAPSAVLEAWSACSASRLLAELVHELRCACSAASSPRC